jgi:hypothetical protein
MASEIGHLTESMLEKLKSLIGAELQNTERKNDNTERYFDPTKFVFLFTTNKMGEIYSKINDNSIITRFQFLIFRNRIDDNKTNGQWYDELFTDEYDKQTAIDTVVRLVLAYKKKGIKTKWSNIAETKQILKEEQPKEDKYFEDGRLIPKEGSILQLTEIIKDFESFVGYKVTPIQLGHILKKNGMVTSQSNSKTVLKGYSFPKADDQTEKMESFN